MQNSPKSFIKKQKKMFFKILFVLGILSLILLVFRSRTETIDIVDPKNTTSMMRIPLEKAQLKIGDIFIKDKIEVQVTEVFARNYMLVQSTNVFPTKGSVYIVVLYHYKNTSSKIVSPSDQPTIKLQDSNGTIYESDKNGTSYYFAERERTPTALSNLNPNSIARKALVFKALETSVKIVGWKVLVEGLGSPISITLS